MLGEGAGVADGAGKHVGAGVLVGPDDAGHLQGDAVVIEVAQAGVGVPQVHVEAAGLVIGVAVGVQHGLVLPGANLLVGPALVLQLHLGLVHGGLHNGVHLLLGLQSQGVQGHVVQLVVLVQDQHHLVVVVGPGAVHQVVLVLQHGADKGAVVAGEHLLPQHHAPAAHGAGQGVHAIAAAQVAHGGHVNAEILLEQVLHQLLGVGEEDVPVHVFRVHQQLGVVGVLHPADGVVEGVLRVV